ncbi:10313_t:CDS:2 [Scutellospora calospora]|uniref:10313_t:CDS:1 n=1 Tax=Scutellospora calospora TaxID=85575 RepID=A0ACA9KMX1_9GLOM|nr:10313_t:CDS:2 [Scutellospora calospora]
MNHFDIQLKKREIYEYKILKLLRANNDGGIDLTRNYNEVFFAIQAKYRKDHHNEQAENIEKFDKALES